MREIKLAYEDLISGDSIGIRGVGHVRSPKLEEMKPTAGIGWAMYSMYIYYMKASQVEFFKLAQMSNNESEMKAINADGFNTWEYVISNEGIRAWYTGGFSFFMTETVVYSDEYKCFLIYHTDEMNDEDIGSGLVGFINNENFEDVRAIILLMNYISIEKTNVHTTHSNSTAEDRWLQAQKYLAEQHPDNKDPDETVSTANILSKLCTISNSYNLLNVYQLTVFQMYDQFFQCCYMRGIEFSEAVVSNHGSKNFKYEDWLKPVKNYE